jgi:hypothetical protein
VSKGWRKESHRHSLAAKGIKTSYYAKKRAYKVVNVAAALAPGQISAAQRAAVGPLSLFGKRYPGSVGEKFVFKGSSTKLLRAPISKFSPAPGGFVPRPTGYVGTWTAPAPINYTDATTGQLIGPDGTVVAATGARGGAVRLTPAQVSAVADSKLSAAERNALIAKFKAQNAGTNVDAAWNGPSVESPAAIKQATLPVEKYGFPSDTYIAPTQQEAMQVANQLGKPVIAKSPFNSSNYVIAEKTANGVQVTEVKAPFFTATGQKERLQNVVQTYKSLLTGKDAVRVVPGSVADVPVVREVVESTATRTGVLITPFASAKVAKGIVPFLKTAAASGKTAAVSGATKVATTAKTAASSVMSKLAALKAKYAGTGVLK